MKEHKHSSFIRLTAWFLLAGLCLVNFGGASIWAPAVDGRSLRFDNSATSTLRELKRFGLLDSAPQAAVEELLAFQKSSGKSLAEILNTPFWVRRLGLASTQYEATWYMANPFELLPRDLQLAIKNTKHPFQTRGEIYRWMKSIKAPAEWRPAVDAALIETTAYNLWRGSRGERPYARNGEFLEPVVVDHGQGVMEVREGHIATDPAYIPTNSEVLLLVKIQGLDRILKVKAADIGSAIKGRHIDIPISLDRTAVPMPRTEFPKEHIRNPSVRILTPLPRIGRFNQDQKAEAGSPSRLPS